MPELAVGRRFWKVQFKLRGRTSSSTSGEEVRWIFVAEGVALGSVLRGQGFGRNWKKTLVDLRCGGSAGRRVKREILV